MKQLACRMLVFAAASFGTMVSRSATAPDPNDWRAKEIEHARATAPRLPDIRFDDWTWAYLGDIGSVLCAKVYWRERPAGWIADPVSAGGALVGRACDPVDVNAQLTFQYIVRLDVDDDGRFARIRRVPHLDDIGYFASPSWCGDRVAYWDRSLRIRSLGDEEFSIDTRITAPDVEGDMPDLHPHAIWSDDCGRLTVPADDDAKAGPISIVIPSKDERSSRMNAPQ